MADALGVESGLRTADDTLLVFQRSNRVAEFPGWYCCPGGHAEPAKMFARVASAFPDVLASVARMSFDPTVVRIDEQISERAIEADLRMWLRALLTHVPPEQLEQWILDELFGSVVDEIVDEVGIPRDLVQVRGITAVNRAMGDQSRGKPDLSFDVVVHLPLAAARAAYAVRRGADAFEGVDGSIVGIPRNAGLDSLRELRLTPASLCALSVLLQPANIA